MKRFIAVSLVLLSLAGPCGGEELGAWYKGDLHCHSLHSDGDSEIARIIMNAELRDLEFLAVTDHDSWMKGTPSHWTDPDYRSKKLILLYGIEWTTEKGHANIWSDRPLDYRLLWRANLAEDADSLVREARAQGALVSINHPMIRFTSSWDYLPVPDADAVEVWNACYRFPSNSRHAVSRFWDDLLLAGRRITAVGGSDNHQLDGPQSNANLHGLPTTWVYAHEPSARGILDGIRSGRVTVSYAPDGDRFEITADADGDGEFELEMGESAPSAGGSISVRMTAYGPNRKEAGLLRMRGVWFVLYRNGKVIHRERVIRTANEVSLTLHELPAASGYYRAELRGIPDVGMAQRLLFGRTLAVTNPIYFGNRP